MTERIDPAVTAKIIQALASYLKRDPASITEEHHLRDDLGLDSVAIIELLFEIEERFKLQIPDQDLPGLSTVGTVAGYVQRRLAESKTESKPESPKPVAAASKSKAAKSTKTKTTSAKSPSTKKAAATKSVMARKSKTTSSGTSGKKKVTAR
jgi:acyl carrier protein